MRLSVFILILIVGAIRPFEDPVSRGQAGPPIEIRLVGDSTPGMESRIAEIQDRFPLLQRRRTTHFEILTDLDPMEAGRHAELLERTSLAVDRFCDLIGIDDGYQSSSRSLVLGFGERVDFLRFASWSDEVHARWLAGYFAPAAGHLAYHHQNDSPYVRSRRDLIDASHDGSVDFDADAGRPVPEDRRRVRLNTFVAEETSAVVVHEAVHMLLHHRGIVPATTATPIWFLEGLAGCFEPVAAYGPFGAGHTENGRSAEFRSHLANDRIIDLETLVSLEKVPAKSDRRNAFYATSAQLCSWLVRHRPDGVRRFIESVKHGAGRDRVALFEATFGPCSRIESIWLADERSRASHAASR